MDRCIDKSGAIVSGYDVDARRKRGLQGRDFLLDYSVLLADADGTVVDTLAEPGQVVSPGQTVIRLAHAGPREASVFLPETMRPRLGSVARATLFGKNASVPARLRQLSDSADQLTRTFEA